MSDPISRRFALSLAKAGLVPAQPLRRMRYIYRCRNCGNIAIMDEQKMPESEQTLMGNADHDHTIIHDYELLGAMVIGV